MIARTMPTLAITRVGRHFGVSERRPFRPDLWSTNQVSHGSASAGWAAPSGVSNLSRARAAHPVRCRRHCATWVGRRHRHACRRCWRRRYRRANHLSSGLDSRGAAGTAGGDRTDCRSNPCTAGGRAEQFGSGDLRKRCGHDAGGKRSFPNFRPFNRGPVVIFRWRSKRFRWPMSQPPGCVQITAVVLCCECEGG